MTTTDDGACGAPPALSRTRRRARAVRVAGLLMVVAGLPLLGPAPAAQAAECTSEVAPTSPPLPFPTGPGCDDPEPPQTSVVSVSPTPNAGGWIRSDSVTIAFAGAYADADTDPITFECQFAGPAAPAPAWSACTSPITYDGLDDTEATPYTFRVRAIDSADHTIDLTADPFFPQSTDRPDLDQTPAETTVRVDTDPAEVFLTNGPYDAEGTGWPIATAPQVSYTLTSNEPGVSYRCQLDGMTLACGEGTLTLRGLEGGPHVLTVSLTDRAGNTSGTDATAQFVMPYNLTSGPGWQVQRGKGYFARDYLQTRTVGAQVKFRARNIREFRILAPAARDLGRFRVRVGAGGWREFNPARGQESRMRSYAVRLPSADLFSGQIVIESLGRRKPVRIDALVFPQG